MMANPGSLADKHILIVEDEYYIASDLKRFLTEKGSIVVGPVADLNQALAVSQDVKLSCAIIDINLNGTRSFPLVDQLMEQSVPLLLFTGYDGWSMPERYRNVPRIAKPHSAAAAVAAVERLLSSGKAS